MEIRYLIDSHLFYDFILYLDRKTILALLVCSKEIEKILCNSKVWIKFVDVNKSISYKYLCSCLENNKVLPNCMKIKDYYSEEYYCFRYLKINPYKICVLDLANSNPDDVKRYRNIIKTSDNKLCVEYYDKIANDLDDMCCNAKLLKLIFFRYETKYLGNIIIYLNGIEKQISTNYKYINSDEKSSIIYLCNLSRNNEIIALSNSMNTSACKVQESLRKLFLKLNY